MPFIVSFMLMSGDTVVIFEQQRNFYHFGMKMLELHICFIVYELYIPSLFYLVFLHLYIDFSKINAGWMGGAVTVILTGS